MTEKKTAYQLLEENSVLKDYSNSTFNSLEYEFDNLKHWYDSLAYWKEAVIEHYYKEYEFIENEQEDEYQTELEHLLSRYKNASEMILQSENTIKTMMENYKEGLIK